MILFGCGFFWFLPQSLFLIVSLVDMVWHGGVGRNNDDDDDGGRLRK